MVQSFRVAVKTSTHTRTRAHTQLDRIDDHNDTQTIAGAFQFNSIRYISMVAIFIHSSFFFYYYFFFLSFRFAFVLLGECVLCRNLKVVLTVAKIEFLFNLYGFVRWPAPSCHEPRHALPLQPTHIGVPYASAHPLTR